MNEIHKTARVQVRKGIYDNYQEMLSEDKETTVYLNDDVADICSEGEPGFDPTHMINCLKIRYEEAKRIYNKKQ